ncbi:hypothetical protein [Denitrobaculum tricleocarpae]|uniref:PEP-CTERM sorting domain-containing protein n=1 Tax=Denitrobaculum tricleocarpae TaxID=2591009 RepID=A0A545U2H3_9PROT|nr:hypothetical protein [Denitrobaculum tricleocarpae]TQV83658.1 hypothetical protein FKG95_03450 [Denitrobaculum tricleocarpae]
MLKRILIPLVIAIITLPAGASESLAGPLTFTRSIGFKNTLGTIDHTVDFNSFAGDALFQNGELDAGPITLSSTGASHNSLNKIEVSPFRFEIIAPSHTPFAALYLETSAAGTTTATMSFDVPIIGFGATFRALQRDTVISYTTATGSKTIVPGITNRFFGFILEPAEFISSLTFSAPVANGFGIDNILLANAIIPSAAAATVDEPNSLVLMLMGVLGLGWLLRKTRKAC